MRSRTAAPADRLDPGASEQLRFQQAVFAGRLRTRSPRLFPRDRGLRSVSGAKTEALRCVSLTKRSHLTPTGSLHTRVPPPYAALRPRLAHGYDAKRRGNPG
ncbi:hypothetical protein GCM10009801_78470 [Streptomyces albiaxialis]|uniref:Uncharacterized protein n=1 Tax=Streptomyces albiaxialis TaxID=329523 RepID=A0ABN2X2U0_9ACTN